MNGIDATIDLEFVNSRFESCRQSTISIRSEEIISQICPLERPGKAARIYQQYIVFALL